MQALEKELQQIKATMIASPPTSVGHGVESVSTVLQPENITEKRSELPYFQTDNTFQSLDQYFTSQKIGDVEVQPCDIAALLQRHGFWQYAYLLTR